MAIDFFADANKTTSNRSDFGLCDDAPPSTNPAYIDEINNTEWIGLVQNKRKIQISFYPVDHCVDIRRANNEQSKRCDGILRHDDNIYFIELKDRTTSNQKWIKQGRKQLTETLENFINHHNPNNYSFQDCYICNKQQPFRVSTTNQIAKFKNDTQKILNGSGLILNTNRKIDIL